MDKNDLAGTKPLVVYAKQTNDDDEVVAIKVLVRGSLPAYLKVGDSITITYAVTNDWRLCEVSLDPPAVDG